MKFTDAQRWRVDLLTQPSTGRQDSTKQSKSDDWKSRAEQAEAQRDNVSDDYWDSHAVHCGNCSVEILARNGEVPGNNGLSRKPEGSEDEQLCGLCAGSEIYDADSLVDVLQSRIDALQAELEDTRKNALATNKLLHKQLEDSIAQKEIIAAFQAEITAINAQAASHLQDGALEFGRLKSDYGTALKRAEQAEAQRDNAANANSYTVDCLDQAMDELNKLRAELAAIKGRREWRVAFEELQSGGTWYGKSAIPVYSRDRAATWIEKVFLADRNREDWRNFRIESRYSAGPWEPET